VVFFASFWQHQCPREIAPNISWKRAEKVGKVRCAGRSDSKWMDALRKRGVFFSDKNDAARHKAESVWACEREHQGVEMRFEFPQHLSGSHHGRPSAQLSREIVTDAASGISAGRDDQELEGGSALGECVRFASQGCRAKFNSAEPMRTARIGTT